MPDDVELLWSVRKALREGRTQDADNLLTKHFATEGLVESKEDAAAPKEEPRTQTEVMHDILTEMCHRFGNPQPLVDLLDEMHAVAPPPAPLE
jgi:hypothetical protein